MQVQRASSSQTNVWLEGFQVVCWCSLLTLRLRNWGRSSCMCSVTTFIGKLKSSSSPAKHTKLIHAAWRRGAACRRPEHLGCCLKGRYPLLKRCRSLIGWLTFSKGMGHSNVAILVSMCVHVLLVELPRCFAWNCPPEQAAAGQMGCRALWTGCTRTHQGGYKADACWRASCSCSGMLLGLQQLQAPKSRREASSL